MSKKVIFIRIGIGVLCILLIVGVYSAIKFYTRPQAPSLSLETVKKDIDQPDPTLSPKTQPTPTSSKTSETETEAKTDEIASEAKTKTPLSPTAIPSRVQTVCGQKGVWIILFLGRSIHSELTDLQSIRLVKVDFDNKNVLIYTLPPELALDTPGLVEDFNIKYSFLEKIYALVLNEIGESKAPDFTATQALAQVILDNFGITADHYITIDNDVVIEAVDTVGGIYVDLPEDFTITEDSKYQGEVLKAGKQLLDGEMIHAYVSASGASGEDLMRIARQNLVIEGMRKKLLNPAIFLEINELYTLYKDHILTDLSLEQITSLGCLVRLVPRDQIVMKEPQVDELTYWEDGSMHFKDIGSAAQQLREVFGMPEP